MALTACLDNVLEAEDQKKVVETTLIFFSITWTATISKRCITTKVFLSLLVPKSIFLTCFSLLSVFGILEMVAEAFFIQVLEELFRKLSLLVY